MARPKAKRESQGAYFRSVFLENPGWLDAKTNHLIKARYEKDHPGQEMTKSIRANMANVKSVMRKKRREAGGELGDRPRGSAIYADTNGLEGLELAIDNCLSSAREMDPVSLGKVIKHLRDARNALVYRIGEP